MNSTNNAAWLNLWNAMGYVQLREYRGEDALAKAKAEAKRLLPVYPSGIMVINAETWNGSQMLSSRVEIF